MRQIAEMDGIFTIRPLFNGRLDVINYNEASLRDVFGLFCPFVRRLVMSGVNQQRGFL